MKEAQKPSEKEALKIYDIEKTMALTVFKKYYPDAIIDFNEGILEPIIGITEEEIEAKVEAEAELKAIADAKVVAQVRADKIAAKKAELQAELKALDES